MNGIQVAVIKEIRATGQHTETYDIGVDKVHNFFADGILIHNCQHDASKSASVLHDVIRPDMIIGLTATPYRTDKAQLCFQKVIRDAGIHQLIREGYLAEFAQHIYDREWTPENIADLFCSYPDRWGKSVIYFLTTADAIRCSDIIKSRGFACDHIVGNEPREARLEAFEKDELQVLTNVAVLTEGFDCPSLKTVFVRPSSKGPTVQMSGRAFRKFDGLPVVNVIQNMDTKYPFTRHARALNQWIMEDGDWMSIDPQNLTPIFTKQRIKVARAVIDMPKYLNQRNKGRFGDFKELQMDV
ncbi:MAG: helicase-related protein [Candidatus Ranarchaeia archaeon]